MTVTTFKAVSRNVEGFTVENKARNFTVIIDEPPSFGGANTGMTPVEALLITLGSCQCIVARAFAQTKGINLEEVWVELEGDLDTDGFLKGAEGVRNGFQEIRLKLHLKSDAPEDTLKAFAEFVASRCPIEDNLVNATRIITETVVEGQ